VGENVTLMVQVTGHESELEQLLVWAKGAPLTVILLMLMVAIEVLSSTTGCALLVVSTGWPGKFTLATVTGEAIPGDWPSRST
jgi:hypothetical protein